jgi:hypothetical protein
MLAIKIGDEFLELTPGSGIQIEDNNPLFMDEFSNDAIQQAYNFPVEAPASPNNNRLLGHLNKPEIDGSTMLDPVDVKVYYANRAFANAKVKVLSAGASYSLNVQTGIAALNCISKKLSELDLGGDISLGASASAVTVHAENTKSTSFASGGKYVFPPHKNESFYGESNPDFLGMVNQFDCFVSTYKWNYDNINKYNLVPWPFLFYVLQQGFKEDGLTMDGIHLWFPEFGEILIYSNRALDAKFDETSVRASSTPVTETYDAEDATFVDETTTPNRDPANLWDGLEYTIIREGIHSVAFSITFNITFPPNPSEYMAVCLVKDGIVIDELDFYTITLGSSVCTGVFYFTAAPADIGLKIKLKAITHGPLPGLPTKYDGPRWIEIHAVADDNLNKYARTLNLQKHVPDMTFGELLDAVFKGLNINYSINQDEKKVYLIPAYIYMDQDAKDQTNIASDLEEEREILFEDPKYKLFNFAFTGSDKLIDNNFKKYDPAKLIGIYQSLQSAPAPLVIGDIIIVLNVRKVYECQQTPLGPLGSTPGLQWIVFSDLYYDRVVGASGAELKAKFSPLFMTYGDLISGSGIVPEVDETGTSDMFNTGDNTPPLRLAFWRGMQPSTIAGNLYPLATPSNRDYNGDEIGGYEFSWDGTYSIFEIFWKRWVAIMNTREWIRWKMNYTAFELFMCKITDRIRIKFKTYLMRKRSIPLGENIEQVEVDFKPLT